MWPVFAEGIHMVFRNPALRTLLLFRSCAPLVGSAWYPPLVVLLILWLIAWQEAPLPRPPGRLWR
jgi:hypothetical protein